MDDRTRTASAIVGAFVLTAVAVLVVGSLWIAGSSWLAGDRSSYVVLLRDTGGIEVGDRVRVAGVNAGRVREITLRPLDERPVAMEITLRADIDVKIDARATIASDGLLGSHFLQISPGSPAAPSLPRGTEIRDAEGSTTDPMARVGELADSAVVVMEKTAALLDQLTRDLTPVVEGIQRMLSEENTDNVSSMLASLRRTTEETGPEISRLIESMNELTSRVDDGMEELPELLAGYSGLAKDLRAALGPDGVRLASVLEAAESTLTTAEATLEDLRGNRPDLDTTLRDLREVVANLKGFSQTIEERPYSLVRVRHEPDRRPGDAPSGKDH